MHAQTGMEAMKHHKLVEQSTVLAGLALWLLSALVWALKTCEHLV